ncbi:hypothetical protein QTL95_24615 [Rhizobium sp. S152]|uniref:hypothetical protein n=1 Tax=Rhizobium sp. S152 TaxID=3055038 RepID=UPI0025AA084E|nr:hypothetical protein [Rhizobium sp. S152]MDM9629076.1 hypothetical protein [Rhizobium sp. S152]
MSKNETASTWPSVSTVTVTPLGITLRDLAAALSKLSRGAASGRKEIRHDKRGQ